MALELSLDESIRLAQIEPGDGATMLRSIAVKGAERFLSVLPPGLAEALGIAQDAAAALAGLQSGDVSGWMNVLQKAQKKWVSFIDGQWALPEICRDKIRIDAAERTPIAAWSQVPLALACGVGKGRKAGRYYWKPTGIGPRVENWAHDISPRVLGKTQSWVPDPRNFRSDGYVFCPAMLPYCVPGERPTTWGSGVAAVMAARYQSLLMDGASQSTVDDLFYRVMAIINSGRLWRENAGGWQGMNPVQVVQKIPANPDPGFVYATPRGQLWGVSDNLRIYSYWNHNPDQQAPIMTATLGELKQMLASLGGLMVRERLAAGEVPQGVDPKNNGGKGPQKPGQKPGGIPSDTWGGGGFKLSTPKGAGGGAGLLLVGGLAGAAFLWKRRRR